MTKKLPLISIIMPVYNAAPFLEKTLDNILDQSFFDFEVLAINDGSTDNSLSILSSYAKTDKRLHVESIKNSGAGIARNRGLDIAKGDYICFIDSDDIPTVNYLDKLLAVLETENSDLACVKHSSFKGVPNPEELSNDTYILNRTEAQSMLLLEKISAAPHCKIYKREIIGDLRFPSYSISEDLFFNYYYLKHCKRIAVNASICYNYRQNPQGLSKKAFQKKRMDSLDAALAIQKDSNSEEAKIRLFMEAEYALEAITKSKGSYPEEKARCVELIKKYRYTILRSKKSSTKQKAVALSSIPFAQLPARLVKIKGDIKP